MTHTDWLQQRLHFFTLSAAKTKQIYISSKNKKQNKS